MTATIKNSEQRFCTRWGFLISAPKYNYDNLVVTDDLKGPLSFEAGKDLKPFFDFYLRTTDRTEIVIR